MRAMNRLRSWFLPAVSGLIFLGVLAGALVNAGNAASPPAHNHDDHDHAPQAPLTLEEAKRLYNPYNLSSVTIVQNPDGTFTIDRSLMAEE